jgi:hypothetical protein
MLKLLRRTPPGLRLLFLGQLRIDREIGDNYSNHTK